MKKTLILGCLLLCITACGGTRTSVKQVQEPRAVVVPEYRPSIIEVRNAIYSGVHAAKWRAQDRAPGLIYATQRISGATMTLAIDYTATSYTIYFKDSTDEDYNAASGNVPSNFPRWARFISKNIEEKIAVIGIEASAQIEAFPRIAPSLPGEPVSLEGEYAPSETGESGVETRFEHEDKAVVLVQNTQKKELGKAELQPLPAKSPEEIPAEETLAEQTPAMAEGHTAQPAVNSEKVADSVQAPVVVPAEQSLKIEQSPQASQPPQIGQASESSTAEKASLSELEPESEQELGQNIKDASAPAVTHAIPVYLHVPGQAASESASEPHVQEASEHPEQKVPERHEQGANEAAVTHAIPVHLHVPVQAASEGVPESHVQEAPKRSAQGTSESEARESVPSEVVVQESRPAEITPSTALPKE